MKILIVAYKQSYGTNNYNNNNNKDEDRDKDDRVWSVRYKTRAPVKRR
jgi:hypothetical protein